ncbi:MAG: protein kinase [Candidatus Sericytochromatia bacterium]
MSNPKPESFYLLESVLGQGSFATTWLAQDTRSGQRCALKKLPLQQLGTWKDLELFERETKTLRHLDHQGIPRLLDAWQTDSEAVLVQEYVPGRNLQQWVAEGRRFSEAEAVRIALQLAGILSYLHSFPNPVIHRDLKPGNVLLDQAGEVHLIDFGAVRQSLAVGGTVTGTFGYMPLEQLEGHEVPASDLYALGATLVFLLTGQDPTELKKIGLKPDFRAYARISPRLARILDKLLEPDLSRRYASAARLQADLLRLQAPDWLARLEPWTRWIAWWRVWLAAGSALVLLAVILYLNWALSQPPAPGPAQSLPVIVDSDVSGWKAAALKPWLRLEPDPDLIRLAQSLAGEVWGISASRLYQFSESQVRSWSGHDLTGSYTLQFLAAGDGGEVWIGTFQGKLFRWQDQRASEIERPAGAVLTALGTWKGQAVAGFGQEIRIWQNGRMQPLAQLPEAAILIMGEGEQLWAASSKHVFSYGGDGWRQIYNSNYETIHTLASGQGRLWAGLYKGLVELDPGRGLSTRLGKDGPVTGLIHQPGRALWQTNTATDTAGLARLPAGSSQWQHLGWRQGLPDDRYTALLEQKGALWLSAANGALWRAPVSAVEKQLAQPSSALITALRFKDACEAWRALQPQPHDELAADSQSSSLRVFWHQQQVCPYGSGFRRSDGSLLLQEGSELQLWQQGRLSRVPLPEAKVSSHSLLLDNSGAIWLARGYPYLIDRYREGRWEKPPGPTDRSQATLLQTRTGQILAGAVVEKQLPLLAFDPADLSWNSLDLGSENYVQPKFLAQLRQGRIALATNKGLYLVDLARHRAQRLEGLPYADVDAVSEDSRGRLWIIYNRYGQGRGLSLWDPAASKLRHLDARQGLIPDRLANLAFDSAGRLWLLQHDDQVSVYTPEKLEGAMREVR